MQVVSLSAGGHTGLAEHRVGIRPVMVLQAALLLLVVANVGRIPVLDLGDRRAPVLINDICITAILGAGALVMLRARSLRLNDVALAALVFAAVGALSAAAAMPRFGLSAFELIGSLAYLARWMAYFTVYLVVINCVRAHEAEGVWSAIERAMLVIAAFGIVQAIFLPNFAFMVYPNARELIDWDPQRNRLVSTVLEPNIVAAMIALVLLVQLARLACGVRTALWKPTVLFAALIMTLSRSGALAFVVGCLVIVAARGLSKRVARFAGLMVLLAAVALPKLIAFGKEYARFGISDASALARVNTWQRAIETFVENPWFGIGFNTYGFVQDHRGVERLGGASYSAEGGLLFIAVMTGIVGLVIYLGMLWFALRRFRKGWRDERASPSERGLLIGAAAATVAILVHSVFVNSLLMPFVMELLWVLWGLGFVVATTISRRALETPLR